MYPDPDNEIKKTLEKVDTQVQKERGHQRIEEDWMHATHALLTEIRDVLKRIDNRDKRHLKAIKNMSPPRPIPDPKIYPFDTPFPPGLDNPFAPKYKHKYIHKLNDGSVKTFDSKAEAEVFFKQNRSLIKSVNVVPYDV